MKTIYYQPILNEGEWENLDIYSFEVYYSFEKCKKDFPNHTIAAYSGDDIENPTYRDNQPINIENLSEEEFNFLHTALYECTRSLEPTEDNKFMVGSVCDKILFPHKHSITCDIGADYIPD